MTNSARLRHAFLVGGVVCLLVAAPSFGDEAEPREKGADEAAAANPDPYAPYGGYLALFGYRNPAAANASNHPSAAAAYPAAYPAGASVPYYPAPVLMPPVPIVSHYAVQQPVGYFLPPPLPHVYHAQGRYKLTPNGIEDVRVRYWWDDGRYTIEPRHRDFFEFYK